MTFEPVPAAVLRPEAFAGRISTPEEKLERLAEAGLDEIVVVPFTSELSRWSPEDFMAWLQEKTGLRELWVGEEFALGKDRAGTVERLTEIGADLGFRVVAVPRLTNGQEVVSSSRVRGAVMSGDVAAARRLLGRPFRVRAKWCTASIWDVPSGFRRLTSRHPRAGAAGRWHLRSVGMAAGGGNTPASRRLHRQPADGR